MPVAFLISVWALDCFVMIVLNVKPKQNDIAIKKTVNVDLFIFLEFILLVVSLLRLLLKYAFLLVDES